MHWMMMGWGQPRSMNLPVGWKQPGSMKQTQTRMTKTKLFRQTHAQQNIRVQSQQNHAQRNIRVQAQRKLRHQLAPQNISAPDHAQISTVETPQSIPPTRNSALRGYNVDVDARREHDREYKSFFRAVKGSTAEAVSSEWAQQENQR